MSTNKKALLNVGKAVIGISFTTLASMGSATGNVWIAGAAALPLGIFAASDTIASLLHNPDDKQEGFLELPMPGWWLNDVPCPGYMGHPFRNSPLGPVRFSFSFTSLW